MGNPVNLYQSSFFFARTTAAAHATIIADAPITEPHPLGSAAAGAVVSGAVVSGAFVTGAVVSGAGAAVVSSAVVSGVVLLNSASSAEMI